MKIIMSDGCGDMYSADEQSAGAEKSDDPCFHTPDQSSASSASNRWGRHVVSNTLPRRSAHDCSFAFAVRELTNRRSSIRRRSSAAAADNSSCADSPLLEMLQSPVVKAKVTLPSLT